MSGSSKIRWRREIEAVAKTRGWTFETTKSGHFKLTFGAHTVIAAGSPSRPDRCLANTLSLMKRYENDTCN